MSQPSEALAIARGEVRDGAAAIEHFLHVLASRRVGPRMLARAVPEVAAGCEPLRAALAALADAVAAVLAADVEGVAATRALLEHARARVSELLAELKAAEGGPLDARARLALEAVVRRIAGELGTVVRLAGLLGGGVTQETTAIDFTDALAARKPVTGRSVVRAAVELRATELRVGDARLLMELLELAVLTVARASGQPPFIIVDTSADGVPLCTVEPGPPAPREALVLDAAMRDEVPNELCVATAAARYAGIAMNVADGGQRVTIAL